MYLHAVLGKPQLASAFDLAVVARTGAFAP
jgi:hypothetical protein